MSKRLFLAIELPKEWRQAIHKYKNRKVFTNLRWLKVDNLHVTVYFLGNVEEKKLKKIVKKLEYVCLKLKPFKLEFSKLVFAPSKNPYMLWAVFKNTYHDFSSLVNTVSHALAEFNLPVKKRKKAVPHITLARFIDKNTSIPKLNQKLTISTSLLVDKMVLFESKQLKDEVQYSSLMEFDFIKF